VLPLSLKQPTPYMHPSNFCRAWAARQLACQQAPPSKHPHHHRVSSRPVKCNRWSPPYQPITTQAAPPRRTDHTARSHCTCQAQPLPPTRATRSCQALSSQDRPSPPSPNHTNSQRLRPTTSTSLPISSRRHGEQQQLLARHSCHLRLPTSSHFSPQGGAVAQRQGMAAIASCQSLKVCWSS